MTPHPKQGRSRPRYPHAERSRPGLHTRRGPGKLSALAAKGTRSFHVLLFPLPSFHVLLFPLLSSPLLRFPCPLLRPHVRAGPAVPVPPHALGAPMAPQGDAGMYARGVRAWGGSASAGSGAPASELLRGRFDPLTPAPPAPAAPPAGPAGPGTAARRAASPDKSRPLASPLAGPAPPGAGPSAPPVSDGGPGRGRAGAGCAGPVPASPPGRPDASPSSDTGPTPPAAPPCRTPHAAPESRPCREGGRDKNLRPGGERTGSTGPKGRRDKNRLGREAAREGGRKEGGGGGSR
jgi:hypothetical protein